MKKLLLGLSLVALLAGCASHEDQNGMGGTSDQINKTDEYNQGNTPANNSSDQMNNNGNQGTGTSTAPNNGMPQ